MELIIYFLLCKEQNTAQPKPFSDKDIEKIFDVIFDISNEGN